MKEKVAFVSLGCDKNLVDSEVMLWHITEAGYEIVQDEREADVLVINTCAFIHDAKEESIENIIELGSYKSSGKCKSLIITGCLAQRYKDDIFKELPEVDGVVGTTAYNEIVNVIERTLNGEKVKCINDINKRECEENKRIITTVGYYEFLKIAEGCYNHCTYCIIPKLRGNYRSRSMESLINEAKELAESGVKELILVAQDVTSYGVDLYDEYKLPELLKELCKIEELKWIRLLYCYPERITDELIETIKIEDKICKYIDMPLQHISDDILKRMGRKNTKEDIQKLIKNIRSKIPEMTIRTTFIVGFPGETKEHVEELKKFINEAQFDRLGFFTYSEEEDTPAAKLDGGVLDKEKERRKNYLMGVQEDIIESKSKNFISQVFEVIVEGKLPNEDIYIGRTYRDAPEVDGLIFFESENELMAGEFVKVEITEARGYDLVGRQVL